MTLMVFMLIPVVTVFAWLFEIDYKLRKIDKRLDSIEKFIPPNKKG